MATTRLAGFVTDDGTLFVFDSHGKKHEEVGFPARRATSDDCARLGFRVVRPEKDRMAELERQVRTLRKALERAAETCHELWVRCEGRVDQKEVWTPLEDQPGYLVSSRQVLRSAAGFYVGRTCRTPDGFPEPFDRESDYFRTKPEAERALESGFTAQRFLKGNGRER